MYVDTHDGYDLPTVLTAHFPFLIEKSESIFFLSKQDFNSLRPTDAYMRQ